MAENNYSIQNDVRPITLNIYFKYLSAKIHYKYLQYATTLVDRIISLLYRWDLDYRN